MKRALPCLVLALTVVAASSSTWGASGTWSALANVHSARDGHTATLLSNGNVVVAGGENNNLVISSTEVFSPTTGSWTVSGNLNVARANAGAILLPSGMVMIAGGCTSNCQAGTTGSAELFNSVNNSWSSTGSMIQSRTYFGMVLLPSGKVLAAGGCTGLNANGCTAVTAKAEVYDPSTGKWSATGSMIAARGALTTTVLPNGMVLAAGGLNAAGTALASAELYNPSTGKWTATGRMNAARDEHTATLLATGNVIVVGGENAAGISTNRTELYNPSTGKWTLTGNVNTGRLEHTATLLMNGNLLIAGGTQVTSTSTKVLASAELYNPSTGKWSTTGSMANARTGHAASIMSSGTVMVISGTGNNNDLLSVESYAP